MNDANRGSFLKFYKRKKYKLRKKGKHKERVTKMKWINGRKKEKSKKERKKSFERTSKKKKRGNKKFHKQKMIKMAS